MALTYRVIGYAISEGVKVNPWHVHVKDFAQDFMKTSFALLTRSGETIVKGLADSRVANDRWEPTHDVRTGRCGRGPLPQDRRL
jgi:hypothetical protein